LRKAVCINTLRGERRPLNLHKDQFDAFRTRETSREIIRRAAMRYVRFPLPQDSLEDLLNERGVDFSQETVRCRWHRVGPMAAAGVRKRPTGGRRTHRRALSWAENSQLPC
jgi:hypothetical protein